MPDLSVTTDGPVMVVSIDRPQARNAINQAIAEGLAEAMIRLDDDPDLSVAVITGSGGYFSAGMDLKAFASGERPHVEGRGFAGLVQAPPAKPLIAAIEGFALAGGLEIALACDVIVAARGARLGVPEVQRGLLPAAGALLRLPARIPRGVAMELVLTGRPVSTERGAELGLVDRLTEPGKALDEALELARVIAANAPLALVAAKRILDEAPGWPADERWARQREIADPVLTSDDAREGARAFAEKRDPVWRGR